jgi:hypothetical protein
MAVLNPDVEELRGPAGEEVRHALDAVLEEIARAASLPAAVTDRRGRVLAHNALFEHTGGLVRLDAPGVAPPPRRRPSTRRRRARRRPSPPRSWSSSPNATPTSRTCRASSPAGRRS